MVFEIKQEKSLGTHGKWLMDGGAELLACGGGSGSCMQFQPFCCPEAQQTRSTQITSPGSLTLSQSPNTHCHFFTMYYI